MKQRGFTYAPTSAGEDSAPEQQPRLETYGITDPAVASRLGYSRGAHNLANQAGGGPALPTLDDLVREHGTAWIIAMFGAVPPATPGPNQPPGCVSAGPAELYDGAYGDIDRSIVGNLAEEASRHTQADRRVVSVEQSWSHCMAKRGFTYANPMQAAEHHWPTPPSAAEIATAVADVRCKQETNLPGVWLAVEAGYQQELIEQNTGALNEFRLAHQKLIRMAQRIVAAAEASPGG